MEDQAVSEFVGFCFVLFSYQNSFPCCLGNKPSKRDVGGCMTRVQASVVPSFHTVGWSLACWAWRAVNQGYMGHVPATCGLRGETDGWIEFHPAQCANDAGGARWPGGSPEVASHGHEEIRGGFLEEGAPKLNSKGQ